MDKIKCYDTLKGMFIDVEVREEIRQYILRSYWREDMQNRRFIKRCIYGELEDIKDDLSVEDILIRKELFTFINNAVSSLQERQRYIIIEHYYKDRTLSSIANDLGISISYTSRLMKKSMSTLRNIYKEYQA